MHKYNRLKYHERFNSTSSPLHFFSFYGQTALVQWDHLVTAHVTPLQLQPGQGVLEAGCAGGAFLDSLQRQFGVRVAGVDLASDLIAIARQRVKGSFCAASGYDLSFIPDETFDHGVSFGVLLYAPHTEAACRIATGLLRTVKPGGMVMLGQINDPSMRPFKPKGPEGNWGVPPLYWYKLGYELGLEVSVVRGEEVYSQRRFPLMSHYDLHAALRYNVYLRKPASEPEGFRRRLKSFSCSAAPRKTEQGRSCYFPFLFCNGGCQSFSQPGVQVEGCTRLGERGGGGAGGGGGGQEWEEEEQKEKEEEDEERGREGAGRGVRWGQCTRSSEASGGTASLRVAGVRVEVTWARVTWVRGSSASQRPSSDIPRDWIST